MPQDIQQKILDSQFLTFGPAGLLDNDDADNLARRLSARDAAAFSCTVSG